MVKRKVKVKGEKVPKAKAATKGAKKATKEKPPGKGPRSKKASSKGGKKKGPRPKGPVQEPDDFVPSDGESWTSPISYDAKSFSMLVRESMDELGFKYDRRQADKMYTQTMVLFPIPKTAYVYRFEVHRPMKVWIDFYDTKPSHAGIIAFMEIHGLTTKNLKHLRELLEHVVKQLTRPPWQFTIGQRFQHGLLIPEWGRSKRAWRKLGFKLQDWKNKVVKK